MAGKISLDDIIDVSSFQQLQALNKQLEKISNEVKSFYDIVEGGSRVFI